jgi:Domain of unknown function (DUF4157)
MPNEEEINRRESAQTGLNVEQQDTNRSVATSGTATQMAAPVGQQQTAPLSTQPPVPQPAAPIMGGQTPNPMGANTNAVASAGEAQLLPPTQTTAPISAGATDATPSEDSAGVAAASGEGFNTNGIQMNRETWEGSLNFLGNTVALPKSKSTWEGENLSFGNITIPNGTSGKFVLVNARVETIVFNRNTGFKSAAITAASISMGRGMKMLVGEPLKANLQKGENAYTLSIPKLTLNGLTTPKSAEFQQVVLKMASDGTLIEGNGLSVDTSKFKDLKLDPNGIFVKAANPEIPTKFVDLKLSWEDVQTMSKQTDNAPNKFWGDLNLKEQPKDEKQSQRPPTQFLGNLKDDKQPKGENQPIESEKLSENTAVQGLLTEMQTAYGIDMSGVEIIKNSPEADKQDAVGVSIGNEIHLAKGEFTQSNPEAMGLLAHELTHFVQKEQNRVSADAIFKGQAVNTDPKLEQEADLVAEKFLAQAPLPTLATEKAKNPTDEVAQLKPKKPFAEWVLLDEQNNYQLYEVDDEYVVCDIQTFELWSIHKLQFNGRFDRNDILLGWQMLTPTEINELQIPLNNLPRKPKTKVPPVLAPPVTNPKQEEHKYVWGETETPLQLLRPHFSLDASKADIPENELIKWEDFIAAVIRIEETFPLETRNDTNFMITQFRKMYSAYDTNAWNTVVIPNTDKIPQEILGNRQGASEAATRADGSELDRRPNVELLSGKIVDMGHVLAGLDAGRHDSQVYKLYVPWLGAEKNIDVATWLGDLSSILEALYMSGHDLNLPGLSISGPTQLNEAHLAENKSRRLAAIQDIQNTINAFCSPQDLLGDVDAVAIDYLEKDSQFGRVSEILQKHYGKKAKYSQSDRVKAFTKAIGLGDWNGSKFSQQDSWIADYASQMSDTIPMLVAQKSKISGGLAAINFVSDALSEETCALLLAWFVDTLKKNV